MRIKAAVGKAGISHQILDAGALDAVLAKVFGRHLDNMLVRRVFMSLFVAHCSLNPQ
jgi:hypothetical protein